MSFKNVHLYCVEYSLLNLVVFLFIALPSTHFLKLINLFILLYNIVLVLPYISMNPSWVYTGSPSWTPLPRSSPYHPSGSSQCTSPMIPSCILHWTWTGDSFHIRYYTCFNAILPNHPTFSLSHRVQKTILYTCVSFAVSHTGLSLPSF